MTELQIRKKGQKILSWVFWGLAIVPMAACSTTASRADMEIAAYSEGVFPETDDEAVYQSAYQDRFKVGDIAHVTFFSVEELSDSYTINNSGNIVMPLVGSVKASGLTTEELQSSLVRAYGADYLTDPSINIQREASVLGRIVVDGAVEKPGVFEVEEIIRLTEAVALAQGLSEVASETNVYLMRQVEGRQRIARVNLAEVRTAEVTDPRVFPGDIVFIEDSRGKIIFREFLRTVPLINAAVLYGTRP